MIAPNVDIAPYFELDEFGRQIITKDGVTLTPKKIMEDAYEENKERLGDKIRFEDTEPKLLEDIARRVDNGETIVNIEIYTELPPCLSCGGENQNEGILQLYWQYFRDNKIDMSVFYVDNKPNYGLLEE